MIWLIIIAVIVVLVIVKGQGYWATKTRNRIHAWAVAEEGLCCDCKHCRKDLSCKYSKTGYFCALSNCSNITEDTRMTCFEKPKVTNKDIDELFSTIDFWTQAGQNYIRESLVGQRMTWPEIDAFLARIPKEHPEYLDRSKAPKE